MSHKKQGESARGFPPQKLALPRFTQGKLCAATGNRSSGSYNYNAELEWDSTYE